MQAMSHRFKGCLMLLLAALISSGCATRSEPREPIRIKVGSEARQSVDPRLFGQFFEKPCGRETGPESATDEHGALRPEIVAMLEKMHIPVVRFPAGTDIDFTDWTDMISNVPGRAPERPMTKGHEGRVVSNRFGFDEYFRLRDEFGWDAILVVNLLDALAKRKSVAEAAQHAAGLVAYVNAPVGSKLPDGMPDWPAVRAKNGHPKPYGVHVFQLGNEWWNGRFPEEAKKAAGTTNPVALAAWYRECILAYADAMRAVDPSIEFIVDGYMGNGLEKTLLPDPDVRRRVKYVAYHKYAPGQASQVHLEQGKYVEPGKLSARDWWLLWSTTPGDYDNHGLNIALGARIQATRALGYEIAITEWNWAAWGYGKSQPLRECDWHHAGAIGVAGFLNGVIRQADAIRIATQSMLVGHIWDLPAIHYGRKPPAYYSSQGMVTTFYNLHHGDRVLDTQVADMPTVERSYYLDWGALPGTTALLDVVATRSERAIFVHAVNRSFDKNLPAEIDLGALGAPDGPATMHMLECVPVERVPEVHAWMSETSVPIRVTAGKVRFVFPCRTVAILEVPVKAVAAR
jgi:alpha-L-arabinofuranosidase